MLAGMHRYAFVKTRPEPVSITHPLSSLNTDPTDTSSAFKTDTPTGPLFLHDELYDLFDQYLRDDRRFADEFKFIAQYYRKRYAAASSAKERSELENILLYYELQVNPLAGYYHHYVRGDEEAIKSYETGLDMRLRDEILLFLDRYTDTASR
jgi:hypothetical protein